MKTRRKALLVGINDYPFETLNTCINDATSLAALLKQWEDGSPNFDTKLHTNITTRGNLRKLIIEAFSGDVETVLFYFSGHGVIKENGGYIATPDHQLNDEGVSMDEILRIVNASEARNRIVILDCCHSGALGKPSSGGGLSLQIEEGVTILTSCRANEVSMEGDEHGLFTNLLLEAVKGGAADLSGYVTPGGIYAYIDQALGHWDHRPMFKTNVSEFTSIRQITPPIPTNTLRAIVECFSGPDQEFILDPSFEDTNSEQVPHEIIEPRAQQDNVAMFKTLQKLNSVGLVVPVGEDHMYFAAMKSKSCKLTPLGRHYWRLVKNERI
jgi:hypothetical protein